MRRQKVKNHPSSETVSMIVLGLTSSVLNSLLQSLSEHSLSLGQYLLDVRPSFSRHPRYSSSLQRLRSHSAMASDTPSSTISPTQHCPLLTLSNELLHEIVSYLIPTEHPAEHLRIHVGSDFNTSDTLANLALKMFISQRFRSRRPFLPYRNRQSDL